MDMKDRTDTLALSLVLSRRSTYNVKDCCLYGKNRSKERRKNRMFKKAMALLAAASMLMSTAMVVRAEETDKAPEYSRAECWYQIPEITRDVDTFYIPATEYVASSFEISRQAHHKCPPCFFPARETVSRQEGGMVGFF